jgi:mannose-6-phosphate isomerase-like protein (cupin superfamily)
MKRHAALVALSHDHQHALAWAARLRRSENEGFAEFYAHDLVPHFRQEEETVFPLLAEVGVEPTELGRALLEHQRIRAGARSPDRALGDLIDAHIRLEERVLFETIQQVVPDERLTDLLPSGRGGPEWGTETSELNATLLAWPAGGGTPAHINSELDVVLVVLDGTAEIENDGTLALARAGAVVVLEKGARRRVTAGPSGVRYLTVHRRRTGIGIAAAPPPTDPFTDNDAQPPPVA